MNMTPNYSVVLCYKVSSRKEKDTLNEKEEQREGTEEHIRQPCVQKVKKGCFVSKKVVQFQNGKES